MSDRKPLVIAHRGASGEAPENTMAAFRLAHEQGADGIELDIFLTTDGEVVVTHDENLERLTGRDMETQKAFLAELRQLDFGKGEKIPTLPEVFEAFGTKFAVINIEIKSTGFFTNGIEKKLVSLIRKFGLTDKIYVSSFNALHLMRMKRIAPEIKRGYLVWPEHFYSPWKIWPRLCGATTLNLPHDWATEARLQNYRRLGCDLWVWTVNTKEEMKRWVREGVSAIITNFPAHLKKVSSDFSPLP